MSKRKATILSRWAGNIKNNTKAPFPKKVGFALLGAALYPLIPWAIKGWLKTDMDGWKAIIAGAAFPTIIGLAINKPEMALAGLGCAATHIIYGVGTGTLQKTFGTAPPRFDSTSVAPVVKPIAPTLPSAGVADGSAFNQIPSGFKDIVLPDGEVVTVPITQQPILTRQQPIVLSPSLNDFIPAALLTPPPKADTPLADFINLPEQPALAGYLNTLADEKRSGLKPREFQKLVSRGMFRR